MSSIYFCAWFSLRSLSMASGLKAYHSEDKFIKNTTDVILNTNDVAVKFD